MVDSLQITLPVEHIHPEFEFREVIVINLKSRKDVQVFSDSLLADLIPSTEYKCNLLLGEILPDNHINWADYNTNTENNYTLLCLFLQCGDSITLRKKSAFFHQLCSIISNIVKEFPIHS